MKKSDEIRQAIAELTDQAEALVNVAEKENRELNADEQAQWSAIMAKDTGEIAKLQSKLTAQVAHEEEVARLRTLRAAARTQLEPPVLPVHGAVVPSPQVRLVTTRLRAFQANGDREQALKDAYDCGLWFKAVLKKDAEAKEKLISRRGADWYATNNETTAADGGYLVPAPLANAIIVSREQIGAMRRLATIMPMSSATQTFTKQTGGTTVYYPGEEGAITASDLLFAQVSLSAKKRAILTYVSNELRDDAIVSVMDLVAQDMGHQFGLKEDQEGIAGDGTSTYGGVLGLRPANIAATASISTAATGHDTWPEIDMADLMAAISLIPDKYRINLSWLCSAAFKFQVFDRLALAAGGAAAADIVGGQPQERFIGYPIVISDRMPTTTAAATVCCLFGNFPRTVVLGDRNDIRFATSEHVAFTTDQMAIRATTRYDIQVHEEGDTSAVGAVVSLKTAA